MTPDAERYLWLRDGKSRYGGYCGSAPFVMSPNRSRLYAIFALRAAMLDAEIDWDIFWTKLHELDIQNEIVERGLLPKGSHPSDIEEDDGPYITALRKLTQEVLGWSEERVASMNKYGPK